MFCVTLFTSSMIIVELSTLKGMKAVWSWYLRDQSFCRLMQKIIARSIDAANNCWLQMPRQTRKWLLTLDIVDMWVQQRRLVLLGCTTLNSLFSVQWSGILWLFEWVKERRAACFTVHPSGRDPSTAGSYLLLIWTRHLNAFSCLFLSSEHKNPLIWFHGKGKKIIGEALLILTMGLFLC